MNSGNPVWHRDVKQVCLSGLLGSLAGMPQGWGRGERGWGRPAAVGKGQRQEHSCPGLAPADPCPLEGALMVAGAPEPREPGAGASDTAGSAQGTLHKEWDPGAGLEKDE